MSWMTTAETAAYANRSLQTIRAALASGDLHGYQRVAPQGKWSIQPECVDAWLAAEQCEHQRGVRKLRTA